MSAPRAMKPLFGVGSRLLLVDQLALPRSSFVISRPSRTSIPSSVICLGCNFPYHRRQLRFSSNNTPPKPPNDEKEGQSFERPSSERPSFERSPFEGLPFERPPFEMPKFEETTPSPEQDSESSSSSNSSSTSTSTNSNTTNTTFTAQETQAALPPPPSSSSSSPASSKHDLPSAQNSRRSKLNKSLSAFMDRAQTTFFAASQRINDLTGYSGIDSLKREVGELEEQLQAAQATLHEARVAYKGAVSSRSATQREVTTLLARQKTWTPPDFERFTQLYRSDYELEAAVADTAAALEEAERRAEQLGRDLSARILARYHEEQIWSDKIRRMSTWGTWGLMGVNVLLFLVFQFGAEPWRRRRLVRGFEQKVREALEEEREKDRALRAQEDEERWAGLAAASESVAAAVAADTGEVATAAAVEDIPAEEAGPAPPLAAAAEETLDEVFEADPIPEPMEPPVSWREFLEDPQRWGPALQALYDRKAAQVAGLYSERRVTVRTRDLTIIALEGAAAGVLFAGSTAVAVVLLLRR